MPQLSLESQLYAVVTRQNKTRRLSHPVWIIFYYPYFRQFEWSTFREKFTASHSVSDIWPDVVNALIFSTRPWILKKMYVSSSLEFVILLLINFCIALEAMQIDRGISEFNAHRSLGWRQKNFLFYRSNAINERACTCSTLQSCRCCENVTLLLIKTQRRREFNLFIQDYYTNFTTSLRFPRNSSILFHSLC